MRHLPRQHPTDKWAILPTTAQVSRLQQTLRLGIEYTDIGGCANAEMATVQPQNLRWAAGQPFNDGHQRQYTRLRQMQA